MNAWFLLTNINALCHTLQSLQESWHLRWVLQSQLQCVYLYAKVFRDCCLSPRAYAGQGKTPSMHQHNQQLPSRAPFVQRQVEHPHQWGCRYTCQRDLRTPVHIQPIAGYTLSPNCPSWRVIKKTWNNRPSGLNVVVLESYLRAHRETHLARDFLTTYLLAISWEREERKLSIVGAPSKVPCVLTVSLDTRRAALLNRLRESVFSENVVVYGHRSMYRSHTSTSSITIYYNMWSGFVLILCLSY